MSGQSSGSQSSSHDALLLGGFGARGVDRCQATPVNCLNELIDRRLVRVQCIGAAGSGGEITAVRLFFQPNIAHAPLTMVRCDITAIAPEEPIPHPTNDGSAAAVRWHVSTQSATGGDPSATAAPVTDQRLVGLRVVDVAERVARGSRGMHWPVLRICFAQSVHPDAPRDAPRAWMDINVEDSERLRDPELGACYGLWLSFGGAVIGHAGLRMVPALLEQWPMRGHRRHDTGAIVQQSDIIPSRWNRLDHLRAVYELRRAVEGAMLPVERITHALPEVLVHELWLLHTALCDWEMMILHRSRRRAHWGGWLDHDGADYGEAYEDVAGQLWSFDEAFEALRRQAIIVQDGLRELRLTLNGLDLDRLWLTTHEPG